MRAKTAAVFAFGFAVGIASLTIGLWRGGALRTQEATGNRPLPPSAAPSAAPSAGPNAGPNAVPHAGPSGALPISPVPPRPESPAQREPATPPEIPPAQSSARGGAQGAEGHAQGGAEGRAQGQAERLAPEMGTMPQPGPHPAMPIAGVNANELPDTFSQERDGRTHEALDIPAPRGTPVLAADEGNVIKLFTSKQGGLTVYQFDDSGTYCYYYAHLDKYARGLKEGMLL